MGLLPQILSPIIGGRHAPPPAILFVRQSTASVNPVATTFNVTVSAPSAGDTAIAYILYASTAARVIASLSMTGTGTWSQAVPTNFDSVMGTHLEMWFAPVTSGGSTTLSVTANLSNILTNFCVNFAEFSGVAASPLDGTGVSTLVGSAGTSTTGAYSTTTANDLVAVSLTVQASTTISAFPAGYTQLTSCTLSTALQQLFPSYRIVSGSGAQSATWTFTPNSPSLNNIIGFKP